MGTVANRKVLASITVRAKNVGVGTLAQKCEQRNR